SAKANIGAADVKPRSGGRSQNLEQGRHQRTAARDLTDILDRSRGTAFRRRLTSAQPMLSREAAAAAKTLSKVGINELLRGI
ncbi:MAG: hypothetical protein AB1591_09890, partial [Pseudomonadota bacterium]